MNDSTLDERFGGVLAPDAMLPSQFFEALRRGAHVSGERRLMVAVLEDALRCYQKYAGAEDPKHRQLFADAEAWINAADSTWFFSFPNVCEALDLDPDYVREGLLKWREARRCAGASSADGSRTSEDRNAELEEPPLRRASGA